MKNEGESKLYIDGGLVIQSFLREGLINNLIISKVPVLIGNGLPLFGELDSDLKLNHLGTNSYSSGLVQSEYECKTI